MSDLIHGGDLQTAQRRFGIPLSDWLDLSTGINPTAYPLPELTAELFQQLPYQSEAFGAAVHCYYGGEGVACSGTQQAIEQLPQLLPSLPVLLPECGYQEHRYSWGASGAALSYYPADDLDRATAGIEQHLQLGEPFHLLLINPNNPTGLQFSPQQICQWAERMPQGGYLIVDEAFIDLSPEQSVLSDYARFSALGNLIVLRSFGKFFGLAGIRLGFIFANESLMARMTTAFGPWAVNGPAQQIAINALQDKTWQQRASAQITVSAALTRQIWQPLAEAVDAEWLASDGLFLSFRLKRETAKQIYQFFAQRGVLIRLVQGHELNGFPPGTDAEQPHQTCLIRSGLVDAETEQQCERLKQVISEFLLTLD
ncbi:aminotransferase class I/II-fold pyridoxal phosphate-dependent enzyme [uncultured Neptuniibacter sp.]|uniref:aminotransferase class I/II-fold pyridoxal phosphate-dependent enzyme n=1 Tax=uncultured Neptuniibacter sp. TaxID=502143 RepID=UPI00260C5014|nr:aminotransferase class I/II-fold pyridoxal phosphate-dependent enzyme [uncultured Neptuniibacter sp.]